MTTLGIEEIPGALIIAVDAGSPADDAGLAVGDIILKVGGQEIKNAGDFYDVADKLKGGTKPISFYIARGNAKVFVAVSPQE